MTTAAMGEKTTTAAAELHWVVLCRCHRSACIVVAVAGGGTTTLPAAGEKTMTAAVVSHGVVLRHRCCRRWGVHPRRRGGVHPCHRDSNRRRHGGVRRCCCHCRGVSRHHRCGSVAAATHGSCGWCFVIVAGAHALLSSSRGVGL
jgi:hypothetical protein